MNKRYANKLVRVLLVGLYGTSAQVGAAAPCIPTQLSDEEAQNLLLAAPALLQAAKAGEEPVPNPDMIAGKYRNKRFYQAAVYVNCQAADGCLIGWYAVDKVTGRVLDTVLIEEETGPELQALQ